MLWLNSFRFYFCTLTRHGTVCSTCITSTKHNAYFTWLHCLPVCLTCKGQRLTIENDCISRFSVKYVCIMSSGCKDVLHYQSECNQAEQQSIRSDQQIQSNSTNSVLKKTVLSLFHLRNACACSQLAMLFLRTHSPPHCSRGTYNTADSTSLHIVIHIQVQLQDQIHHFNSRVSGIFQHVCLFPSTRFNKLWCLSSSVMVVLYNKVREGHCISHY